VSLSPSFSDLRGTIKKERELGEVRELRSKVEILSSQCRTNEEIISRLEEKVRKLKLSRKQEELEDLRPQIARLDTLREKTAAVGRLYNDLENKFNQ
jgi:predicted nuclease with TOPRIM domain